MAIPLTAVDSSVITAVSHAADILEIRFTNTSTYRYSGVPETLAAELVVAPSKGYFFNRYIRPHFAGVRQAPLGGSPRSR